MRAASFPAGALSIHVSLQYINISGENMPIRQTIRPGGHDLLGSSVPEKTHCTKVTWAFLVCHRHFPSPNPGENASNDGKSEQYNSPKLENLDGRVIPRNKNFGSESSQSGLYVNEKGPGLEKQNVRDLKNSCFS